MELCISSGNNGVQAGVPLSKGGEMLSILTVGRCISDLVGDPSRVFGWQITRTEGDHDTDFACLIHPVVHDRAAFMSRELSQRFIMLRRNHPAWLLLASRNGPL
ncbi:MAG TPA: hypothetical protein VG433_05480, partial [Pirellulales bacterium]|nr:hypothetical protein [Pirellulales bacterium]